MTRVCITLAGTSSKVVAAAAQTTVYVKRDDELWLGGNKARKLLSLHRDHPRSDYVSYGGGQSNAMLALARLAASHGRRLIYFARPLPAWLAARPAGNLAQALDAGMELVVAAGPTTEPQLRALAVAHAARAPATSLFVERGGHSHTAETGVAIHARELATWSQKRSAPLTVVLPSGCGTTAFYLHRHITAILPSAIVYAAPVVGGAEYLRQQLHQLTMSTTAPARPCGSDTNDSGGAGLACTRRDGGHGVAGGVLAAPCRLGVLPMLPGMSFSRPHRAALAAYYGLQAAAGLEVDLLYGAPTWAALGRVLQECLGTPQERGGPPAGGLREAFGKDRDIVYVHTGGTEGNASMLQRYQRQPWFWSPEEEAAIVGKDDIFAS